MILRFTKIILVLMLTVGTFAYAATTWNPAGNGIYPPATGNWNTAANWTAGVPVAVAFGEIKGVFNVADAAECQVTGAQSLHHLVQGDNGPGGVIRVVDGGSLTTGVVWAGIGYNNTAHMIVETGGVVNLADHLWIGFAPGAVGTLELEGGTVNVAGMFGLGWNGGTGYANIKDGTLNLSGFSSTQSISGASVMDIELGTAIINGDQTGAVHDFITVGKITGFGGDGTVAYEYNVTNPGKTTITARPPRQGDINKDGYVDINDLILFTNEWLYPHCGSEANFDELCKVDLRDFAVLASSWMEGIITNWHIASTQYPTDDMIVTPHYAANLGIVADGTTDVTDAIQSALISISNLGGGALFYLPAIIRSAAHCQFRQG